MQPLPSEKKMGQLKSSSEFKKFPAEIVVVGDGRDDTIRLIVAEKTT